MKGMLLVLLFFNFALPDLNACREMLDHAVEDKALALKFYKRLKVVDDRAQPVMVGFRAMSEFLMCKHLLNPFSRLSHFNKGKSLLESAIKEDGGNVELLFFRLCTQSNVPALLNYNSNIEGDKQALINYLLKYNQKVQPDPVLYKRIKTYLLMNKYCSTAEKAQIKTL